MAKTGTDRESFNRLVEALGTSSVAWIGNLTEATTFGIHAGEVGLQPEVDGALTTLFGEVSLLNAVGPWPTATDIALLRGVQYDAQAETSAGNAVRRSLGGDLPDLPTTEGIDGGFLTIARDMLPVLLARDRHIYGGVPFLALEQGVWRHPRHRELMDSIAASADLAPLAAEPEGAPVYVDLRFSEGGARTMRAESLVPSLLASTIVWLVADGEEPTPDRIVRRVTDRLADLRTLLSGGEIDAPVVVALSGVPLAEDAEAELPGLGRLRAARTRERMPESFDRQEPTAVLQRSTRLKLDVRTSERPEIQVVLSDRRRHPHLWAGERAATASILALDRALLRPAVSWSTLVRPLIPSPGRTLGDQGVKASLPEALSQDEMASVVDWAGRLDDHHHPSLDVSVRRLLSSLGRREPEDAIVDAVMVWENVVAASGEVTFRVTAGITVLIERDPAKRFERQRSLKKVYNLRSSIVHGGSPPAKSGLDDALATAQHTAVGALRSLYRDFPHLTSDTDRGTRLLLGDVRPR